MPSRAAASAFGTSRDLELDRAGPDDLRVVDRRAEAVAARRCRRRPDPARRPRAAGAALGGGRSPPAMPMPGPPPLSAGLPTAFEGGAAARAAGEQDGRHDERERCDWPVDESHARVLRRLAPARRAGRHRPGRGPATAVPRSAAATLRGMALRLPFEPPLDPMLAKAVDGLPDDDGWLFEPKWDGFRAIVFRDGDEIYTQSRDLKPLDRYFPELADPLRAALPGALRARRRGRHRPRRRARSSSRSCCASIRPPRGWRCWPRSRRRRSWPGTCSRSTTRTCATGAPGASGGRGWRRCSAPRRRRST